MAHNCVIRKHFALINSGSGTGEIEITLGKHMNIVMVLIKLQDERSFPESWGKYRFAIYQAFK